MSIYDFLYVYPDFLYSPVNGYKCKRITKQNVNQFGFNNIEELHQKYPDFPLICEEYYNKIMKSSNKGLIKGREIKKQTDEYRKTISKQEYHINPKKCPKCNSEIEFEKINNKFCSRKCANSRTQTREINLKRSITIKNKKTKEPKATEVKNKKTKKFKQTKYVRTKYPHTKIRFCNICGLVTTNYKGKYCINCSPNVAIYRHKAKFTFNVYEYPNEFDLSLIEKYGWYSPNGYKRRNKKPNLNGVSRDHLYSVSDGFKNNVDPVSLAHPANCRIMVHNGTNGNNSKNHKSSISLKELLYRIKAWDEKYFDV